jgi:hypothetical protein
MSSFDQPLPPYNASDPNATFVGTSCLDFLLIEIVPMAYRIANELEEASDRGSKETKDSGSVSTAAAGTISSGTTAALGTNTNTNTAGRKSRLDEDEEREAVFFRLEALGYRVGLGLVERYALYFLAHIHLILNPTQTQPFSSMLETLIPKPTTQLLPRPPTLHRYAGRHQVRV